MTPEGKVKAKVRRLLTATGAYFMCPVAGGGGKAGVPDFLICFNGRFITVETKANGGKPTKIQEYEMQRIRQSGGTTLVIDETNLDLLETVLVSITHDECVHCSETADHIN